MTTGTGSGKSLAYIVPIVDRVLRERDRDPGAPGSVMAIVVYPMNALANSQRHELERFLTDGYGWGKEPVSFARCTGQESERVVPLPQFVLAALREHREEQQRERERTADLWAPTIDDLVFTTPTGTPIDHRNDYRRWKSLLIEHQGHGLRRCRLREEPR